MSEALLAPARPEMPANLRPAVRLARREWTPVTVTSAATLPPALREALTGPADELSSDDLLSTATLFPRPAELPLQGGSVPSRSADAAPNHLPPTVAPAPQPLTAASPPPTSRDESRPPHPFLLGVASGQPIYSLRARDLVGVELDAGPDQTVDEGALVMIAPSVSDPGDAWNLTLVEYDWGDGTVDVLTIAGGFPVPGLPPPPDVTPGYHTYRDNDDYTVTVTVFGVPSDSSSTVESAVGSDDVLISVVNVDPTLDFDWPQDLTTYETLETGFTGLNLRDAGADGLTLRIDWGDGTEVDVHDYSEWEGLVLGAAGNHIYADDDPSDSAVDTYTVVLTVTDDDGGTASTSLTATVRNMDPVVFVPPVNPWLEVREGEELLLFGYIQEALPPEWIYSGNSDYTTLRDTYDLEVDWGDGSPVETFRHGPGLSIFEHGHVYLDDDPSGDPYGSYTIHLRVRDDDGGVHTRDVDVFARNQLPEVQVQVDKSQYLATGFVRMQASYSDKGPLDTHTATVFWGEGTSESVPVTTGSTTLGPLTHTYATYGGTTQYLVSVSVRDDDDGVSGAGVYVPAGAPPIGVDDVFPTPIDTPLVVPAPGVLRNDYDPDWTTPSVQLDEGPSHGTLVLRADGSFDYTPDPGFNGTDEFSYFISDGAFAPVGPIVVQLPVYTVKWVRFDKTQTKGRLDDRNPTGISPQPDFGGGWRIFPDTSSYTLRDTAQNVVHVSAQLWPAVFDVPVYLRVFDVDDPSGNADIDPNGLEGRDNRGQLVGRENDRFLDKPGGIAALGEGYRGRLRLMADPRSNDPALREPRFTAEGATVMTKAKRASGLFSIAEVDLAVSFNPGDNFRVVASVFEGPVAALDDKTGVPTSAEFNVFGGTASEQLSVWRHLHIERDAMSPIPWTSKNNPPLSGTIVGMPVDLGDGTLEVQLSKPVGLNQFNGGNFYDGAQRRFTVIRNGPLRTTSASPRPMMSSPLGILASTRGITGMGR